MSTEHMDSLQKCITHKLGSRPHYVSILVRSDFVEVESIWSVSSLFSTFFSQSMAVIPLTWILYFIISNNNNNQKNKMSKTDNATSTCC